MTDQQVVAVLQDAVANLLRTRILLRQQRRVVELEQSYGDVNPVSEQYVRRLEEALALQEKAGRLLHRCAENQATIAPRSNLLIGDFGA